MSRTVEREYVEDDRDVVVDRNPFYTSPLAIALAVIAGILLVWMLIAANSSDSPTINNEPAREAPARDAEDTGTGGDQTGGGSGDADSGTNTGNGGNSNSGADGGANAP